MNKLRALVVQGTRTPPNFFLVSQQPGKCLILGEDCKLATPEGFFFLDSGRSTCIELKQKLE